MTDTGHIVPVENGAEAFLEVLNANRVDYIFLNPGTSSGSIQEALSKYKSLGKQAPNVITCLHEYMALSAAHGYYMVSGRPQVVLVHLALGTLQMGGSLLNAQRGRAAAVICATRVPYGREGNESGMPAFPLHWIHEEADQAAPVRDYVKWEYELRSVETLREAVQRAFRISSTEPSGPTYLVLPQDLMGQKMKEVRIPPVNRYAAAAAPQVDNDLLEKAADILIAAENPLIITGYTGRNPDAVKPLIELAETIAARVASSQTCMNFPTAHPLSGRFGAEQYLKGTDVVLILDDDVPYIAGRAGLKPGVKLIHFDIDPVKPDFPMWGFAADILAQCDTVRTLPLLKEAIINKASDNDKKRFQARFQRYEKEYQESVQSQDTDLKAEQVPISADWLCHCINEVIDEDTIIVDETVTNSFAVRRHIQRARPGTLFGNAGASLGWALGASLGAKLASPEKTVVSLVGDGTFIFGEPIAALWAANRYHAPFLCVVFNNRMYNAPKMGVQAADGGQSYSEKTGVWVGLDIVPPPEYAMIGQACGGYGRMVENPGELKGVLEEALESVKQGKPAVVDVRI